MSVVVRMSDPQSWSGIYLKVLAGLGGLPGEGYLARRGLTVRGKISHVRLYVYLYSFQGVCHDEPQISINRRAPYKGIN